MATIRRDFTVSAGPDTVWDAVRDVGNVHTRLVPGFIAAMTFDGAARHVTFANGMTVTELIVTVDDDVRRVAYAAVGGRATHHNSSVEVAADDNGGTRLIWTTDLLPDELAPGIASMMDAGIAAIVSVFNGERAAQPA